MSNSVEHVFVVDAVLACCRLDVHLDSLGRTPQSSISVDDWGLAAFQAVGSGYRRSFHLADP